jgi:hypothetical protein
MTQATAADAAARRGAPATRHEPAGHRQPRRRHRVGLRAAGAVHDLTAARIWGITAEAAACGLVVLGGKGSRLGLPGRRLTRHHVTTARGGDQ